MATIIPATHADAAFLADQLDAFNHAARPGLPLQHDEELRLKAMVDGQIVGGALAYPDTWPSMYLHILWVDERRRGQGLGTLLLEAVEAEARRRGQHILTLNTYDFQGHGFYLRHGYAEAGQIPEYLPGITLHYLYKKL